MHKKILVIFLIVVIIITAGCNFSKDNKNIAKVIDNYSGKLEKCTKIQIKKLLVQNSYIDWEINNSGSVYTGIIPVGGNLIFCNRQEFSSASLNISVNAITSANSEITASLTGPNFLDIENYPAAKFILRNLSKNKKNYTAIGDLTIKGITKTVKFDLNITQIQPEFNITGEVYFDLSQRNINSDLPQYNLFKTTFNFMTRDMKR